MSEWHLGNWNKPVGQAIIYCKQADGNYTALFCDAVKKIVFGKEVTEGKLESILKTAKSREIDIINLGEIAEDENYYELALWQVAEYDALYHKQPENMKTASSRLPAIK